MGNYHLAPGSYIFSNTDEALDASSFTFQVTRDKLLTHLDFLLVRGEGSIGIDAIRKGIGFLASTPSLSAHKILVIAEFHLATSVAQHAFLKTFEEPPFFAYIFLVTPYIDRLLKTIVSRAQVIQGVRDSKLHAPSFMLQEMTIGERLMWLEKIAKEKKDEAKVEYLHILESFLQSGVTKKNLAAIKYASEAKWKIEQGFPNPKLLVEGFLVTLD